VNRSKGDSGGGRKGVGGKSFKRKKRRNWVGGGEKMKFQKKIEIMGENFGKGARRK
jgi:hypothetical protein